MRDAPIEVYERQWSVRDYLRQFYAGPEVSVDEAANARFLAGELRTLGRRFASALEFGCGPTVHHAASLVPWVDQLDLSDYLDSNLAEVDRWLRCGRDAHDWSVYLSGVLDAEGTDACDRSMDELLAERQSMLRARVARLLRGDIRARQPLGRPASYDLVASFYCLEAVACDREEWSSCLAALARLVAPGGVMLLGAMRRCHEYSVMGRVFPTACVCEEDFAAELPRLGFSPAQTVIEVIGDVGWGEQGFDSICCVRAVKGASGAG